MPPSKKPAAVKASKSKAKPAARKASAKKSAPKSAPSKRPRKAAKAAAKAAPKPAAKPAAKRAAKAVVKAVVKAMASKASGPEAGAAGMKPPAVVKPPTPANLKREFAIEAGRMLADYQCSDVVVLDVSGRNQVMDYLVIGSGTSATQMRSVLDHVDELGKKKGFQAFRSSRDEGGLWLLLDCVDVIVHLFEPNTRAHYDLEMLWGDAPRVAWERADQVLRDRAGLKG